MGMDVNIFVTGFALRGFTKTHQDLPFPAEFVAMAPMLAKGGDACYMERTFPTHWKAAASLAGIS